MSIYTHASMGFLEPSMGSHVRLHAIVRVFVKSLKQRLFLLNPNEINFDKHDKFVVGNDQIGI